MGEIYNNTLKYYWLAISRFLPELKELLGHKNSVQNISEIFELIEAYEDIHRRIGKLGLDFTDPNKTYNGEPDEVENWMGKDMLENLSRLSIRLLESWKNEFDRLNAKKYKTEVNLNRIHELRNAIWPLEATIQNPSSLIGKYNSKGALVFPGENEVTSNVETIKNDVVDARIELFSPELIKRIPPDLAGLCIEFNFCYQNGQPNAAMLLLRRILPLSIVRIFQKMDREEEVKNDDEYHDTKALLGKVVGLLQQKRIHKELEGYKLLVDSSQHSYSVKLDIADIGGPAITIRLLLDELFV